MRKVWLLSSSLLCAALMWSCATPSPSSEPVGTNAGTVLNPNPADTKPVIPVIPVAPTPIKPSDPLNPPITVPVPIDPVPIPPDPPKPVLPPPTIDPVPDPDPIGTPINPILTPPFNRATTFAPLGTVLLGYEPSPGAPIPALEGNFALSSLSSADLDDTKQGIRVLQTTYQVSNTRARAFKHLMAVAYVSAADQLGQTSANRIEGLTPEGSPLITDSGVARSITPTTAMKVSGTQLAFDASSINLQGFTTAEVAKIQLQAQTLGLLKAGDTVLGYGFALQQATLEPGQKGTLNVALRLPRRFTDFPKPYRIGMHFLWLEASRPRVTRAPLETTDSAVLRALALAAGPSSAPLANNSVDLFLLGNTLDTPTNPALRILRQDNVRYSLAPDCLLEAPVVCS